MIYASSGLTALASVLLVRASAFSEAGQLVLAYKIYRCWVSEYEILPDLDANANAIAIEHIKLENEGWERDQSVKEPIELSFKKP